MTPACKHNVPPATVAQTVEHALGKGEVSGSIPDGGSMRDTTRIWRNGNVSPCQGDVPGPIPGIRSMAGNAPKLRGES
jgi:hypothetical protein